MLGLAMSEEVVVAAKPSLLRRRGIEGAVGALIGLVLACLSGPQFVSFWYKPLSGDAFNPCSGTVTQALNDFVKLQLTAGLIGSAFILLVSFLFRRMLRKRREARAVPSA
jgi:hypothetical protein